MRVCWGGGVEVETLKPWSAESSCAEHFRSLCTEKQKKSRREARKPFHMDPIRLPILHYCTKALVRLLPFCFPYLPGATRWLLTHLLMSARSSGSRVAATASRSFSSSSSTTRARRRSKSANAPSLPPLSPPADPSSSMTLDAHSQDRLNHQLLYTRYTPHASLLTTARLSIFPNSAAHYLRYVPMYKYCFVVRGNVVRGTRQRTRRTRAPSKSGHSAQSCSPGRTQ